MTNRRNRTLTPAIPFIFLSDATGAQCFDATGGFHTWDTIAFKTSDFHYTVDDDRVQINRQGSGWYEITFEVSWYTEQILREIKTDLYINGTLAINSHIHTYVTGAGGQPTYRDQHVLHYIIYLTYKDYIQIKSTASASGVCTDPASSRLMVKFIPIHGWNNDAGGRVNFRGGVDR
jgi:hypothetical protein